MKTTIRAFLFTLFLLLPLAACATTDYYPPCAQWERKTPEAVGMDTQKLAAAVEFAQHKAVVEPKDLARVITDSWSPREPDFRILGPQRPREKSAGLVIRKGYIVAEWGDVERVDMTFSAVKSYLSTIMALALRQPTPAKPDYGYMWWLNTDQKRIPSAPASAFWAAGFGGNYVYVDQQNDLLIVLRWVPALEEVVQAIMESIL